MYGLGPEKSLRLVYETFFLAIALLFTSSSILRAGEYDARRGKVDHLYKTIKISITSTSRSVQESEAVLNGFSINYAIGTPN